MSTIYKSFTPADAAVVLVDHQPGVLAMVGSLTADVVRRNVGILAGSGERLDIPLVVTSTRENLDFLGTNLEEIQQAAPPAYANRVRRAGALDAFQDPAFVAAVAAAGRQNLVMSGLLTDVCLFHTAVSATAAGYNVLVVADASGTSSTVGEAVSYDRLASFGVLAASTYGILFELYPNPGTPDGQRAQAVAAGLVSVSR